MKKNNVILREANGFNVSNGSTTHRGVEYEARCGSPRCCSRCALPAPMRATSTISRAPSTAARPSSRATTSTRRRATCTTSASTARFTTGAGAPRSTSRLRGPLLPRRREYRDLPGSQSGQPARHWLPRGDAARQPARRQCIRHRLRRSRGLRVRQLPLLPGARPRVLRVLRLRDVAEPTPCAFAIYIISGLLSLGHDRSLHQDRPQHHLGVRAGGADVDAVHRLGGVRRRRNPARSCCARAPASAPCAASARRSIRRATCAAPRTT